MTALLLYESSLELEIAQRCDLANSLAGNSELFGDGIVGSQETKKLNDLVVPLDFLRLTPRSFFHGREPNKISLTMQ